MYGIVPTIIPSLVRTGRVASMVCCGAVRAAADAGEAEVEHLDAAVGGNHHVGRLEIAMRDLLLVRRGERIGQRHGELEEARQRQPARRDQRVERLPLDELHRQEADAVGFLSGVDGDDVRVIERGDGARFTAESLEPAPDRPPCRPAAP